MAIKNKPEHDPISDNAIVDAYMRWALMAAEEVAGKSGLAIVLKQSGLETFVDNYPAEELRVSGKVSFGQYANLSARLFDFFGRAGKSMTLRIGRLSAKYAIEKQSALFGLGALVASKILPLPTQIKMGLEAMQSGFRKLYGEALHVRLEDRGDRFAYIDEACATCAGKQADAVMCYAFTGALHEALLWQTGKTFDIVEVECRAMGAPACVWEISKTPKE